ncbi:hypothetical protein M404DRAFT_1006692, partial [Pisolithus tinctorius Marx 270]
MRRRQRNGSPFLLFVTRVGKGAERAMSTPTTTTKRGSDSTLCTVGSRHRRY